MDKIYLRNFVNWKHDKCIFVVNADNFSALDICLTVTARCCKIAFNLTVTWVNLIHFTLPSLSPKAHFLFSTRISQDVASFRVFYSKCCAHLFVSLLDILSAYHVVHFMTTQKCNPRGQVISTVIKLCIYKIISRLLWILKYGKIFHLCINLQCVTVKICWIKGMGSEWNV